MVLFCRDLLACLFCLGSPPCVSGLYKVKLHNAFAGGWLWLISAEEAAQVQQL